MAGMRKKKALTMACCWVAETVERRSFTPTMQVRNSIVPASRTVRLPRKGIPNQSVPNTPIRMTSASPIKKSGAAAGLFRESFDESVQELLGGPLPGLRLCQARLDAGQLELAEARKDMLLRRKIPVLREIVLESGALLRKASQGQASCADDSGLD